MVVAGICRVLGCFRRASAYRTAANNYMWQGKDVLFYMHTEPTIKNSHLTKTPKYFMNVSDKGRTPKEQMKWERNKMSSEELMVQTAVETSPVTCHSMRPNASHCTDDLVDTIARKRNVIWTEHTATKSWFIDSKRRMKRMRIWKPMTSQHLFDLPFANANHIIL